eukprot:CFRG0654T1
MNFETHRLGSGFHTDTLRSWQSTESKLTKDQLIYPLFLSDEPDQLWEIPSLPNQFRIGANKLIQHVAPFVKKGLKSVILFGVVDSSKKDDWGTYADDAANPVMLAIPVLRKTFPDLLVIVDVCLCPYSSTGHCGVFKEDGAIDNAPSIQRLADISVNYAKAGAQVVAPSDMLDNRIGAIRQSLKEANLDGQVSIMSYSAKFASAFYGPFREAAASAPSFGDRRNHQLPPGSRSLAIRAGMRDAIEGADMLMVKPGGPYLDIIRELKDKCPQLPMCVYQVSGEYALMWHGAAAGAIDLKKGVLESMTSFRRAGCDCIITYYTPLILDWLDE